MLEQDMRQARSDHCMTDILSKTDVICLAFHHLKEIRGRTKLQKILYFASLYADDIINDYRFYQYGPYSEWVRQELDTLVHNDIVREKNERYSEGQAVYSYELTDNGRSLTKFILNEKIDSDIGKQIKTIFDEFIKFSKEELEIMSSLVFLKRINPGISDNDLVDLVKQYKPWFSKDDINKNLVIFSLLKRMDINIF